MGIVGERDIKKDRVRVKGTEEGKRKRRVKGTESKRKWKRNG